MDPQNSLKWRSYAVRGSDAQLKSGYCVTAQTSVDCRDYWFSGETTVIVGATPRTSETVISETAACWNIHVDPRTVRQFSQGFLVAGCIRFLGGLHTERYNSRADVYLNGRRVDGFALRIRPDEHSDYFHRLPVPDIVHGIHPFSICQTTYAWSISGKSLDRSGTQGIDLRIDQGVRWDIDYIGLLIASNSAPSQVFLSYSWKNEEVATKLVRAFEEFGITVWVDRENMQIGSILGDETRKAIEEARYLIALISEHSITSEWVREEIKIGLQIESTTNSVKVLPVILGYCQAPAELGDRLQRRVDSPEQIQKVAAEVNALLRS